MSAVAAAEPVVRREVFAALSLLFRYPDASYPAGIDHVRQQLMECGEEVRRSLACFSQEISALRETEQQSVFTSTFDLGPVCSPYLGVHLFGDESRDRARLMSGLQMTYHKHGVSLQGRELPDHIAEVLGLAAAFGDEEWADFVRLILGPALVSMNEKLGATDNPFRHLLAAVRHLIADVSSERRAS
jgi:nitrate reductase molybdenum cofactor assembly chaperone NarJ/NarW